MTEQEKSHKDLLEVSLLQVVIWLVALIGISFAFLYEHKLDKVVFDEHQQAQLAQREDIREIRRLIEQRANQLTR